MRNSTCRPATETEARTCPKLELVQWILSLPFSAQHLCHSHFELRRVQLIRMMPVAVYFTHILGGCCSVNDRRSPKSEKPLIWATAMPIHLSCFKRSTWLAPITEFNALESCALIPNNFHLPRYRFYWIIMPLISFVLPTWILCHFFGESFSPAWHVACIMRHVYVLHAIFLINSVAHHSGMKRKYLHKLLFVWVREFVTLISFSLSLFGAKLIEICRRCSIR